MGLNVNTLYDPVSHTRSFLYPFRKSEVFSCFQEVYKETSGMKWADPTKLFLKSQHLIYSAELSRISRQRILDCLQIICILNLEWSQDSIFMKVQYVKHWYMKYR